MKKTVIIWGLCCISLCTTAQTPKVRIGNMEIIVKKQEQDTTLQINVFEEPCPDSPSEPSKPKNTFQKKSKSSGFGSIGFVIPNNGSGYYTTLGGNSINLEIGGMKRYYLTRWFVLGGTLQYSYYNYKLNNANEDPYFIYEVLEDNPFDRKDAKKQVFRSHNIATSAFARFYLSPSKYRGNNGLYIDVGAQGDFAPFRHYMVKFANGGKDYYKNDYAFNPFYASAIARIGWKNSRAIFVRYRFTDNFNQKALPMDLPPITFGIQWF